MRCIELLNEEHHLVLRLVKVVKAIGRDVAHKEVLDSEDMQRIITLFDTFVNSSHELKEESALFPTLIERAGTEAQEELRARIFEHNQERSLIDGMREAMMTCDCKDFVWCAERLADFLAEHVRKEYLLFKKFEALLKPGNDRKIVREFNKIDAELGPKIKDVSAIVDGLERKYAVAA